MLATPFIRAWHVMCRLALAPASRVRWKILAPFVALSLIVSLVGTYLATRLVSAPLEERFANQLVEASRVAADSVRRAEQEQLGLVRSVAFTSGVPAAVARGDSAAVEALVAPLMANAGAEAVYVIDAEGRPLYTAEAPPGADVRPAPAGLDPAGWSFASRALAGEADSLGDKFAGLAVTGVGDALLVAGPIRFGNATAGAVIVGTSLSTIVRSTKQQALADLTVFDAEGQPIASSFAGSLNFRSANPSDQEAGAVQTWEVAGRDYSSVTVPLRLRGEVVATVAVSLPNEFLATAQGSTQSGAGLFFAALTTGVLVIGWSLSRLFTGPLTRLVLMSRQVAAGDLTLRSGIVRRDEIGELAASFDTMTEALRRQHLGALEALVSAVDARDPYTRGHSVRVGHLARELATAMGVDARQVQNLQLGGYFHDVGKIGIRDTVLLKPGSLTPEERAIIQTHPSVGYQILAPIGLPQEVLQAVVGHHERLDGSGYPFGLRGPEVPLAARVVTVADVYDALITDRPYRAGMELAEVMYTLRKEAALGLLDPDVVAVLAEIAEHWELDRAEGIEILQFGAVELDPGMFRAAAS